MADRVLILGASARAAAASARRAGLDPFAIDLFADADTRQICDCLRCPPDEYPAGLFRLARQAPPMPWLYTGGLENYPELIGELARERELWGNGPKALLQARSPAWLANTLRQYRLDYPRSALPGLVDLSGRRWLRKPWGGAGGAGVRFATAADLSHPTDRLPFYLQEFVPGEPRSVTFANYTTEHQVFLGETVQLIGTPWLHAGGFRYAGNIGPVAPVSDARDVLYEIGDLLMCAAGLTGVWGVDFILGSTRPVTIEVNPRYPASAEVLEYSMGVPILKWVLWAVTGEFTGRPLRRGHPPANRVVGKAIYYAPARLTFPDTGPWEDSLTLVAEDVWARPDFADVPHPGTVVEAGHPVLTILTDADDEAECVSRLQSRAAELDRLFGFPTPAEGTP